MLCLPRLWLAHRGPTRSSLVRTSACLLRGRVCVRAVRCLLAWRPACVQASMSAHARFLLIVQRTCVWPSTAARFRTCRCPRCSSSAAWPRDSQTSGQKVCVAQPLLPVAHPVAYSGDVLAETKESLSWVGTWNFLAGPPGRIQLFLAIGLSVARQLAAWLRALVLALARRRLCVPRRVSCCRPRCLRTFSSGQHSACESSVSVFWSCSDLTLVACCLVQEPPAHTRGGSRGAQSAAPPRHKRETCGWSLASVDLLVVVLQELLSDLLLSTTSLLEQPY